MTFLLEILPIMLGYLAKLVAIRSKAQTDALNLAILANQQNNKALDAARQQSNVESPMAAWNRRFIIVAILGMVIFTQTAPVFLDVPTVIPTVREGLSFFGFQITPDEVEYITVKGMLKLQEVFNWGTLIVEFYFGSQLAKS